MIMIVNDNVSLIFFTSVTRFLTENIIFQS